MKEFGIIGHPLSYTLSPAMHNAAFQKLGISARYRAFPVKDIEEGLRIIQGNPLEGASITIPHKTAVKDRLDGLDKRASQIGSVNTVVRQGKALVGYNTDWIGVVRALEEVVSLAEKAVLLMGAGGSGRAAAYGIGKGRGTLWVANRDGDKGKEAAAAFGGRFLSWRSIRGKTFDVVINATPEFPPFPPESFHKGMVVMDLAYGPRKTPFLAEAEKRGCMIVDGRRVLLFQGMEQFELWTGKAAPRKAMEKAVYG
ncbi:MAG: shikimate dehydrogenase [Deltaproteobacteria bacterium]|nr:shikimate dehydrogenase [Deltaproteobacteria bacterium]